MAIGEWRMLDTQQMYHVDDTVVFPRDGFVVVVDIILGYVGYRYVNDVSRTRHECRVGSFIDHASDIF